MRSMEKPEQKRRPEKRYKHTHAGNSLHKKFRVFFFLRLLSIDLECTIHGDGSDVRRVLAEADAGGECGVVVEHLELLPLFAQIDPANKR